MPRPTLDEIFKGNTAIQDRPSLDSIFKAPPIQQQVQEPDSVMTKGLSYIKEHPVKSFFDPITKTLTGESLQEKSLKAPVPLVNQPKGNPLGDIPSYMEHFTTGLMRDTGAMAADVMTSPATLATGGLAKIPGVQKGVEAIAKSKAGQAVGRVLTADIGKAGTKVKNFVKESWMKSRPDYLVKDVAPEAQRVFEANVTKFTPEIENYAKDILKIPDEAIQTIKTKGTNTISKAKETIGSTDNIGQKINDALAIKDSEVSKAYSNAFSKTKDTDLIPIEKTQSAMRGILKKYGYIDNQGQPTSIARPEALDKSIARDRPLDAIFGYYNYMSPEGAFPGAKATSNVVGGINKSQWNLFRDNLSKLRREGTQRSKEITGVLNALHDDAEKAGIQGIKEARNLARENFNAHEVFKENLYKENKLNNFFEKSFTQEQKRSLKGLESYIKTPFIEDLKSITASKYLDKIQDGKSLDNFVSLVNKAEDPKYTVYVRNQLKDLIGQKNADKIIKEVISYRKLRTVGKWAGRVAAGTAVGAGIKIGHDVAENF